MSNANNARYKTAKRIEATGTRLPGDEEFNEAHEFVLEIETVFSELLQEGWSVAGGIDAFSKEIQTRMVARGTAHAGKRDERGVRAAVSSLLSDERAAERWASYEAEIHEKLDEMKELVKWWESTTPDERETREFHSEAIRLHGVLLRLADLLGDRKEFAEPKKMVVSLIVEVAAANVKAANFFEERQRGERLAARAARRSPELVPETRKCSSCHRKPARLGDLCKKCARASGIVVHGKI